MVKKEAAALGTIKRVLVEYFRRQSGLVAVYLFGSIINEPRKAHDIDVGLLFERHSVPDFWSVLKMRAELSIKLGKEVDIAVLNEASPVLGMQVLRRGALLLERNRPALLNFIVRTQNEYTDLKIIRRPIEQGLLMVNT